MPGPLVAARAADSLPSPPTGPARPPAAGAAPGGKVAAVFWIAGRLLFFLPALALIGAFFFASFWLLSALLLGIGTIAIGWLGVIAAMLAFDCLPEAALRESPFGLVRRPPPGLTPAGAAKESVLARILGFYGIYAAIFWVFVLTLGVIIARLFLF